MKALGRVGAVWGWGEGGRVVWVGKIGFWVKERLRQIWGLFGRWISGW
jgi:hypothetical protein